MHGELIWRVPSYGCVYLERPVSHPTVGVTLFGSIASARLSSSRKELPVSVIVSLV